MRYSWFLGHSLTREIKVCLLSLIVACHTKQIFNYHLSIISVPNEQEVKKELWKILCTKSNVQ